MLNLCPLLGAVLCDALIQALGSGVYQVVGDLMLRIQRIPDFTSKLLLVRKRLLGLEPEGITYVLPAWFCILIC